VFPGALILPGVREDPAPREAGSSYPRHSIPREVDSDTARHGFINDTLPSPVNVLIDNYVNINPRSKFIIQGIHDNAHQKKLPLRLFYQPEDLRKIPQKDSRRLTIVLSESRVHSETLLRFLNENTIHPIFVNDQLSGALYPFSYIAPDLYSAIYKLTKLIVNEHPEPSAFVGFNGDSFADKCQAGGFTEAAAESGVPYKIIANTGNIDRCIKRVLKDIKKYKNYICANDELALLLIKTLKENGLSPDNFNISGSSNTKAGALSRPSLTTVMCGCDYYTMGMLAVNIYVFQHKSGIRQNILNNLECKIVPRESTHLKAKIPDPSPGPPHGAAKFVDFYGNPSISRIEKLEYMFANCDRVDMAILHGLRAGKTYEGIAELNNIAINTVKYRIKKMENNLGIRNRAEHRGRIAEFDLDV
jgi:DNA-binding LacI/PurR family transcriptional regulator